VATYFLDSSAILKLYVREVGHVWTSGLVWPGHRQGNSIHVARIAGVEVVAALARRKRGGSLSDLDASVVLTRFRRDFSIEFELVAMTPKVLTHAMILAEAHALRGYDAVQLAAALRVHDRRATKGLPPLTLISSDLELNAAALAEGLAVDDPNAHP